MDTYEKKYKDALERARQFSEHPLQEDSDSIVEYIFPELCESEDEKIRKEILDCFRTMKRQGCFPSKHKEQYNPWIAWLEKQGEHANFRNKIQIGDKVTRNRDGVLVNLSQLKRVAKSSEEQGEQKPFDYENANIQQKDFAPKYIKQFSEI